MKIFGKKIIVIISLMLISLSVCLSVNYLSTEKRTAYNIQSVENEGVVSLISGEFYGTNVKDDSDAYDFLDTLNNKYGFSNARENFVFTQKIVATNGFVYRFDQVYNGYNVYGRSLSINVDDSGRVLSVSGNYKPTTLCGKLEVPDYEDEDIINATDIDIIYSKEIVIYNRDNVDAVCYLIKGSRLGNNEEVVIDALTFETYQSAAMQNGVINSLSNYELIDSSPRSQLDYDENVVEVTVEQYRNKTTGDIVYLLSDSSRKIYMSVMAEGKTINSNDFYEYYEMDESMIANDNMVVEAYKNLIKCYDFYADDETFGIDGLKNESGAPIKLIAVVHARESTNKSYDNAAYWILNANSSYAYFLFGDGGSYATNYAKALDVVGHEYQHGITTSICNLEYLNESGAINEAISDIFGALIEGYELTDDNFWLMGESITNSYVAFRDMKNPKNPGLSDEYPAHTDEMYPLTTTRNGNNSSNDYGGVHYNSVILEYFTYKMYSYFPEFFTRERIGELWYNTLIRLNKTSDFADFRLQMLSAANSLYYHESVTNIINRAFAEVGIFVEGTEVKIDLYITEEDSMHAGGLIVDSITTQYGKKITLPASRLAIGNKVFYYWVDEDGNKYYQGDEYVVPFENTTLTAVFISAEDIGDLELTLKGAGTTTNPYLINSTVEFLYVSKLVNNSETYAQYGSAEYSLKTNIYLNNMAYTPIGKDEEHAFRGSFSGENNTIYGLNLYSHETNAGLFGINYGSIYNLFIGHGTTSTGVSSYVGAIAGQNYGLITTCWSGLSINDYYDVVGGLVGITYSNGSNSITNCYCEGNISSKYGVAGGIIGECKSLVNETYSRVLTGYIGNVYSTGEISGSTVGGIAGRANGFNFVNCIFVGTLEVDDDGKAGGIVGNLTLSPDNINLANPAYAGIYSCKVTCSITNKQIAAHCGMLVGELFNPTSYVDCTNGYIIIENNTIKNGNCNLEIGNYDSLTPANLAALKKIDSKWSNDVLYEEGDFDFDNKDYYWNSDNWTITSGVSIYNLESVWEIVESKQMPKIVGYEFWINYAADGFDGGDGTSSRPFLISTPEQLALLSLLVNNQAYFRKNYVNKTYYADCYYKLTSDIDLTGKIWVGIGVEIYTYDAETNEAYQVNYVGFNGNFDGDGHTIVGMNSMSAYSAVDVDSSDPSFGYYIYQYNAGLFSLVSTGSSSINLPGQSITTPTISNLNMRNVSVTGGYSAALVSHALSSVNIRNIKIHSGTISGQSAAGGILAAIGNSVLNKTGTVSISGVMNNAVVSSKIAGGIVGCVMNNLVNGSTVYAISLHVDTSVNHGKILGFGSDIFDNTNYYGLYIGGILGLADNNSLSLHNNIFDGEIVMYCTGFSGGLVGALGYQNARNSSQLQITTSYNKISGKIIQKFESASTYVGNMFGAGLQNTRPVSLTDTNSASNIEKALFGKQDVTITKNVDSIYCADSTGEGQFNYTSYSYYSSSKFNTSYPWSQDAIKSNLITIYFIDDTGAILGYANIEYGGKLSVSNLPDTAPRDYSDAMYNYTYESWGDLDNTTYDETTYLHATYTKTYIEYTIKYKLLDGTLIAQRTGHFGDKIDQSVEAPERPSSFLFNYEFSHWRFDSNATVINGDMEGVAIYKVTIGKNLLYIFISFVIVVFVLSFIIKYVKRRKA